MFEGQQAEDLCMVMDESSGAYLFQSYLFQLINSRHKDQP